MPYARTPLSTRFDRFVDRSAGPDACWPWTGGNAGGYGVIGSGGHRGKSLRASLDGSDLDLVGELIEKLAKRLHPDAGGSADAFKELTEAYEAVKGKS